MSAAVKFGQSLRKCTGLPSPKTPGQLIGARIRELRIERRLTQRDIARATGICRDNVARVERGRHSTTIDVVLRIAAALEVNPTAILCVLDGNKSTPANTTSLHVEAP